MARVIVMRVIGSKAKEMIFVVVVVTGFSIDFIKLWVMMSMSMLLYCFGLYKFIELFIKV